MEVRGWSLDREDARPQRVDILRASLLDAVHEAMLARGISPRDLSRSSGMAKGEVRQWLVDPLSLPVDDMLRLLGVLGINLVPVSRP